MAIYAIGDLHLSFNKDKPMDIFGDKWNNYEEKIKTNWIETVQDNDTVILPGDFSWATYLQDTLPDFEFLNKLPGRKILIKGNHDYWWTTLASMQKFIKENNFENIEFLFNNATECEDTIIAGTRGWSFNDSENSDKMLNREAIRLENSIKQGIEKYKNDEIICAMHYPPIIKQMIENGEKSEYLNIMKKYNISTCIYGHLHGKSHSEAIEGNIDGINLKLVSSDYLDFKPYCLKNSII